MEANMTSLTRKFSPVEMAHTTRKIVEITDTPLNTVTGRNIIRRVEKILMPNGRYRYPVTYVDVTPGIWPAKMIRESEKLAKDSDIDFKL